MSRKLKQTERVPSERVLFSTRTKCKDHLLLLRFLFFYLTIRKTRKPLLSDRKKVQLFASQSLFNSIYIQYTIFTAWRGEGRAAHWRVCFAGGCLSIGITKVIFRVAGSRYLNFYLKINCINNSVTDRLKFVFPSCC